MRRIDENRARFRRQYELGVLIAALFRTISVWVLVLLPIGLVVNFNADYVRQAAIAVAGIAGLNLFMYLLNRLLKSFAGN